MREFGNDVNTYTFSFIVPRVKVASELDMPAAKTFFGVVKRTNTFQWTDNSSTVRTVRIMTNPIRFEPFGGGKYAKCTIELKEQ